MKVFLKLIPGFFMLISLCQAEVMHFDVEMKFRNKNTMKESKAKINARLGNEFVIDGDHMKAVFVAERVGELNSNQQLQQRGIVLTGKFFDKLDNGEERLISRPEMIVLEGDRASFSVESSNGEKLELSLLTTAL